MQSVQSNADMKHRIKDVLVETEEKTTKIFILNLVKEIWIEKVVDKLDKL